jgi:regulator of replication initiation timing
MGPDDYQLVRIGLLAAISDRAAELGQEIFDEAAEEIADLSTENDRLRDCLIEYEAVAAGYASLHTDLTSTLEQRDALRAQVAALIEENGRLQSAIERMVETWHDRGEGTEAWLVSVAGMLDIADAAFTAAPAPSQKQGDDAR